MFTKEIMETFTELDLSVYDCIVKNRDRVSRMTIKELADTAHVGYSPCFYCHGAPVLQKKRSERIQ